MRVIQAVAERGSITAAAAALGYTQPTVSRQLAAAERRAGAALFIRSTAGVQPTRAGAVLLGHIAPILHELDQAAAELSGTVTPAPIRLGVFPSAGAILLPEIVPALHARGLELATHEGSTAGLIRSTRSGAIDAAIVTQRPPFRPVDRELPALISDPLFETRLMLAVAANGPFAARQSISVHEAVAQPWIAPPRSMKDPHLGVWPGLPGRPRIAHRTADWLTRLALVAAGAGVTTLPSSDFATALPGIHVVRIDGAPEERRRVSLIRPPQTPPAGIDTLIDVLREVSADREREPDN